MCGILAAIGKSWQSDFEQALASIESRGPDAGNCWRHETMSLGHRRLSIIDKQGGAQPMVSPCGRYVLSYNGEIYNFQGLRSRLSGNYSFQSNSDTEVLLAALVIWGLEKTLRELDGMFAFVLWDTKEQVLVGSRDPLGIKPLFYSQTDGFIASSTMTPFWYFQALQRTCHLPALRDYLASQTIFSPLTLLNEVSQLEPGHYFRWDKQSAKLTVKQYWQISGPKANAHSFDSIVDSCDELLRDAVSSQMVADVPLGAFLSGGVDSSLLVYYMSQASGKPVKTFSFKFKEAEYDESVYARAVAKHCRTEHFELSADSLDANFLYEAIEQLDQPLGDPAYLPLCRLSQLTREHVTVALSGDGGDELFCGYKRFLADERDYPDSAKYQLLRMAIKRGLLPPQLLRRGLRGAERLLYQRIELGDYPHSRKSMSHYLNPELVNDFQVPQVMEKWRAQIKGISDVFETESLMRADLWTYLSDNCLTKTDRASMSASLEVRVPLLAKPVVDFVLPLPASVHLQDGLKSILRTLMLRYFPRELVDRPKHGFSVPLKANFMDAWRPLVFEAITDIETTAPMLNAQAVRKLATQVSQGKGNARLYYRLMVLLLWLKKHPLHL